KVLDAPAQQRLKELDGMLTELLTVTKKQIGGQALTPAESEFLRALPRRLAQLAVVPNADRLQALATTLKTAREMRDSKRIAALPPRLDLEETGPTATPLITDVHTDSIGRRYLQVGSGAVDLGLFLFPLSDGRLILAAGPSLSYYEFGRPIEQRLSDAQWQKL